MEAQKDIHSIDNIELVFLKPEDYGDIKKAMIESYSNMPEAYWKEHHIKTLVEKFPEGQVGIKVDNELAGCAFSIIVDYSKFDEKHTYHEITGRYTFSTHTPKGDKLYGIDVFIRPKYRGLRLARRLYDYRKELCEKLNLKGIVFGGRIPNYHQYSDAISPREYIDKVRKKKSTIRFSIFKCRTIFIRQGCCVVISKAIKSRRNMPCCWNGTMYITKRNQIRPYKKTIVRLGLITMANEIIQRP
jgi:GNAT superfamily N-acetyltransferase